MKIARNWFHWNSIDEEEDSHLGDFLKTKRRLRPSMQLLSRSA